MARVVPPVYRDGVALSSARCARTPLGALLSLSLTTTCASERVSTRTAPAPGLSELLDPVAAAAAGLRRLPLEMCRPGGSSVPLLCGRLEVPENHARPGGRTLSLSVVVVPALAPEPSLQPWFDLEGGPSDSATSLAADYTEDLSIYRQRRDVVLVDQRGTGRSQPLRCSGLDDPKLPTAPKLPFAEVGRCVEAAAKEVDLRRYGTSDAVRDLDAVRSWLGYERIHLFGYSYGSLVAQAFMRRYPERVSTAVLWGPVAPDFERPRHFARDTEKALEGLFQACQAEPAQADGRRCGALFPDPAGDARQALSRLRAKPARVLWRRPGRLPQKVPLTAPTFGESIGSLAYDTALARTIPWILRRAAEGDWTPFVDAANVGGRLRLRESHTLMYLAVTCPEETQRIRDDTVDAADAETIFGRARLEEQRMACRIFPSADLPDDFWRPVSTQIPVLVFSGSLDPVTPPRWGRKVIARMPNARLVVVEGMGHGVEGMSAADCPDRLANALAEEGTLRGLDFSCLEDMQPTPFYLGPKRAADEY